MVKYQVNINHRDENGSTVLFWACRYNKNDVVEILLSENADPNICTTKQWHSMKPNSSPLMMASRKGNAENVKKLLRYKADINLKNSNGDTALSIAKKGGHNEVVKILEDASKGS